MNFEKELQKLSLPKKLKLIKIRHVDSEDFLGHATLDGETIEINNNFSKFGLTKEHELYVALHELGHLNNRIASFILHIVSLVCLVLSLILMVPAIGVIISLTLAGFIVGLILILFAIFLLSGFYSLHFVGEIRADDFARSKLKTIKKEYLFYEATDAVGKYKKPNPGLRYRLFYFLVSKKEVAERYKSRNWCWFPKLPF